MGTEKPDDNNGKGKPPILESNDPINPIGTTAESNDKEKPPASTPSGTSNPPASSNPQPILQSNDPNPVGATEEFNDLTSGQNFTGDILHYSTISGSSPAYGLGLSAFMAHSSSGQLMPSFGHTCSPRGIGLQFAQTTTIQPPLINLYGTSLGSQEFDPWGGTHKTGPSHGSVPVQTGNILPGAAADDNITGQGSIPQASNILGKRECESSPPVASSKKIAISPPVGSMPCRGLNNRSSTQSLPPTYTEPSSPSSHESPQPTYIESSSSPYNTDSQTTSSTESPTSVITLTHR